MSARGPGGRIPNQGRGPQAKGQGKNSKRHDLERQKTPGLADSDLQQGDVEAMEQGQRIAPITKQADAVSKPQSSTQNRGTKATPQVDLGNMKDVINQTVGGTAPGGPTQMGGPPDKGKRSRAEAWIGFHTQLARHPASSPLYKAKTMEQVRATIDAQSFSPAVGGALFMRDTDDALEMMARGDLRRE